MPACQLRLSYNPTPSTLAVPETEDRKAHTVTVPLRDVLLPLLDAAAKDRAWLRDFEDDHVTISTDLYEVILAYQHLVRFGS